MNIKDNSSDIGELLTNSERVLSKLTKKSRAIKSTLTIKTLKNNLNSYLNRYAG